MATPWVCNACRSKQLVPRLRAIRSISQSTHRNQNTQAQDGIDALLQDSRAPNKSGQYGHGGRSSGPDPNISTRGRYSGKELRPEELLNQLGQPWQNEAAGSRKQHSRRRNGRPAHDSSSIAGIQQEEFPRGQKGRISPEANNLAQRFIVQVKNEELGSSWQTLQQLDSECKGITFDQARTLFTTDQMVPCVAQLLSRATRQWLEGLKGANHEKTSLPTPLELHALMYGLKATSVAIYRTTLWHVACGIAELRFSRRADEDASQEIQSAIGLLVRMWRVSMAVQSSISRRVTGDLESTPQFDISNDWTDWSFLPPAHLFDTWKPERRSHMSFEQMLHMIVPMPKETSRDLRNIEYASAALITLDLLRTAKARQTDGQLRPLTEVPEYAPFVNVLETLLSMTPAPRIPNSLRYQLSRIENPELLGQYHAMIARLGLHDHRQVITPDATSLTGDSGSQPDLPTTDASNTVEGGMSEHTGNVEFAEKPQTPQIESFALMTVKRLGRAMQSRDMYRVEKIRREVYAFADSHQGNPNALPLELYEHLMMTFLSLRNPKAAIDIWNHVIKLGYKPTVKTYSVMMRGARTSRDHNGMEAFWQKMRQAGLQPDEHAWSIRIYGLFGFNEKQGFQALNDMGREWLAAAKSKAFQSMKAAESKVFATRKDLASELLSMYPGPVDGVPRPNVVIVNSAIASLAHKLDKGIANVLRWGQSFRIEPDLTTYNALLNVSMRKGEAAEALNILKSMQARGIQGDMTTWTVLLTALIQGGFIDGLSHDEQQHKVLDFVRALEDKETGMPGLNEKGYALIIDRLLKHHSNSTAADAVLARMVESGLQPTCHIYTILMTSYFDRQPEPDLNAVQNLWRQIQSQNKGWGVPLDNVFYDRMIEGYARHHRQAGIQPALGFLKRARQAGQKSGWVALEAVARALAEREMWSRLRALVEDARMDVRENRAVRNEVGQNSFFSFILKTGVFNDDGIYKIGQFLPAFPKEGPLLRAAARAAQSAWS